MHRQIKSFVVRSRMTRRHRQALETYWPFYGVSLDEAELNYVDLFQRIAPVVIEIGFGMGNALVELAISHPDINFLGVEVHPPGVSALLATIAEKQVTNIRLIWADALSVLGKNIFDDSLAGILLFFPDPWPKRRHHKRRIVQPEFVELVYRKLNSGGLLHLATDMPDYARHMLTVINNHKGFVQLNESTNVAKMRSKTKFELRGERLGHPIIDLIFKKQFVLPRGPNFVAK